MLNDKFYDEHDIRLICSIEQMLDLLKELEGKYKKNSIYFRGQEWKDKLLPSIGRKPKFCGEYPEFDPESEVNLLHRFRRWAYLELKRPVGEWEALFLGRHHLLPVRLLDWTSNPLFALYFASEYEKETEGDAAVWVIVKDDKVEDIDILKEEWKPSNGTNKKYYYQNWNELPEKVKEGLGEWEFRMLPEEVQESFRGRKFKMLPKKVQERLGTWRFEMLPKPFLLKNPKGRVPRACAWVNVCDGDMR